MLSFGKIFAATALVAGATVAMADITRVDFTGRGVLQSEPGAGSTVLFSGYVDINTIAIPDDATGVFILAPGRSVLGFDDFVVFSPLGDLFAVEPSFASFAASSLTFSNGVLTGVDFFFEIYSQLYPGNDDYEVTLSSELNTFSYATYRNPTEEEEIAGINITILERRTFGSFTLDGSAGVPEPATWGMMIAGFGAVGLGLRRQRPLAA